MNSTHKRLRRYVATGALATVATASLAAIGAGASSASVPARPAASGSANTFQILSYGDAQDPVEKWAVQQYNKTAEGKKMKAVFTTIPGANYQTKLQTIMSTKNAPDVFFNWGSGSIEQFQKAGLLLPLNGMFKQNPALKSSFLPSILSAAKIGANYYGVPMRGTQPVVMFYNKQVLQKAGVPIPTSGWTWSDLLNDVNKLKAAGIEVPIALGGKDQWPTLMWFEYAYDRVAGPSLVINALAGKKSEWSTAASKTALSDLGKLVNTGAFGPSKSWDSVAWTDNTAAKELGDGDAGFELMGSWGYGGIQSADSNGAALAKAGDLGYVAFPSIPGGKGNLNDLAGNTENYYSVLKNTTSAQQTGIADFLKIMYSTAWAKKELGVGNLTTTKNTPSLISGSDAAWLKWQYNLVNKAPAFQLSWDQAYPQTDTEAIHTAVANYFDNVSGASSYTSAENTFIKAMQGLTPAS